MCVRVSVRACSAALFSEEEWRPTVGSNTLGFLQAEFPEETSHRCGERGTEDTERQRDRVRV